MHLNVTEHKKKIASFEVNEMIFSSGVLVSTENRVDLFGEGGESERAFLKF